MTAHYGWTAILYRAHELEDIPLGEILQVDTIKPLQVDNCMHYTSYGQAKDTGKQFIRDANLAACKKHYYRGIVIVRKSANCECVKAFTPTNVLHVHQIDFFKSVSVNSDRSVNLIDRTDRNVYIHIVLDSVTWQRLNTLVYEINTILNRLSADNKDELTDTRERVEYSWRIAPDITIHFHGSRLDVISIQPVEVIDSDTIVPRDSPAQYTLNQWYNLSINLMPKINKQLATYSSEITQQTDSLQSANAYLDSILQDLLEVDNTANTGNNNNDVNNDNNTSAIMTIVTPRKRGVTKNNDPRKSKAKKVVNK